MIADPDSRWVASTVWPSSISRMVSGRAVHRGRGERVAGVEEALEVTPGAREGLAQLVDDDHEVALVDRLDEPVEVEQQHLGGQGRAVVLGP